MIPAHDGGGDTGAFGVDRALLTQIGDRLAKAADDLDAVAESTPATGGAGAAESLLVSVLGEFALTTGEMVDQAHRLAAAVETSAADYGQADVAVGAALTMTGQRSGGGSW